ncbi:MAG: transposase [Fibrobacteraceae bacterium]
MNFISSICSMPSWTRGVGKSKWRRAGKMELGRMIKGHWPSITSWFRLKVSNAMLEGLNSLVKATQSRQGVEVHTELYGHHLFDYGKLGFSTVNPVLGKC